LPAHAILLSLRMFLRGRLTLWVALVATVLSCTRRSVPEADARPVAAPVQAKEPTRLRVAVVSDLNGAYGSTVYGSDVHQAVQALVTQVRPNIVLITGDMVAGQQANLRYADMWKSFHTAVTEPLSQAGIPVAPAPGNHDASGYAPFAAERAEYVRQWSHHIPSVTFVDRSAYPLRYSFELDRVFFLALDATTPGQLDAAQRAWAEAQLSAATEPVKIGYGHLPLHPVALGRVGEVLADFDLEATFAQHSLTAYLSGHHHAYYPGAAAGFRQVAMPCLGGGPRPLVGTATKSSPKALVVIDIERDRITSVDALEAPSYTRPIDRKRLPERILHGRHALVRDDLAGL